MHLVGRCRTQANSVLRLRSIESRAFSPVGVEFLDPGEPEGGFAKHVSEWIFNRRWAARQEHPPVPRRRASRCLYDVEPLPGHFPGPVGLPLLKETHLSHLGKLMFEWSYWHSLLPGRDILGVHRAMRLAGKVRVTETKEKETPS